MVLSLKTIGYYDHENFGDEQYKISFDKLFSIYLQGRYTIQFIDCDKIDRETFTDKDIIIIGGGDVLNNYFLEKIKLKFHNKKNLIIALSVGVPYTKIIVDTSLLDMIDYIFIRTTRDLDIFQHYFYKDRICYIPDLSYILTSNYNFTKSLYTNGDWKQLSSGGYITTSAFNPIIESTNDDTTTISKIVTDIKLSGKVMGICLSRHFYNKHYQQEYENILESLSEFIIDYIVEKNWKVVFIPFNTNNTNDSENDILFANDIIQNIDKLTKDISDDKYKGVMSSILNITNKLTHDEMCIVFQNIDLCIPMRFHSVLYCIYNFIPFIPVYSTRKIQNLLMEIDWKLYYEIRVNDKYVPVEFDRSVLDDKINKIQNESEIRENIYQKLLHININIFGKMFLKNVKTLIDIILCRNKVEHKTQVKNTVEQIIDNTFDTIVKFANTRGYSDYRTIEPGETRDTLISIITYNLVGFINSDYDWGLSQKIFDLSKEYNYKVEWRWIINDHINKKKRVIYNNPNGLFNMEYVDQVDYSGAHRSGWQYVYENIKHLNNTSSNLLLDLYLDRTFHWNSNFNKEMGIIPYKKSWIGFVHHTFDTTFSDYNCNNLFSSSYFKESLKTCRGIIVLSNYLKEQFVKSLQEYNIRVEVYVLTHPTEIDVKQFEYKRFYNNKNKRLVHIGGWLRNIYSFYNLTLPEKTFCKYGLFVGNKTSILYHNTNDTITKYALRGKNMTNYYPDVSLLNDMTKMLEMSEAQQTNSSQHHCENVSQHHCGNVSQHHCGNVSQHHCGNVSQHHCGNVSQHHCVNVSQHHCGNVSQHHCGNVSQHHCGNVSQHHCGNVSQHHCGNVSQHHCENVSQHHCGNVSQQINASKQTNELRESDMTEVVNNEMIRNNWNKHFLEDFNKKIRSVNCIDYLNNDNYDDLITENIVFINLVDASAVNTVIECIVRTTPIIVNKHPAVIELLGENYPLYFSETDNYNLMNFEIYGMIKDDRLIRKAHKYLKNIDKNKFSIDTFVDCFQKLLLKLE